MKPKTFTAVFAVVTIFALSAVGIAFAETAREAHRRHSLAHLTVLDHRVTLTRAQRREWRRIRPALMRANGSGIASAADYQEPHPVSLPDGYGEAWVLPAEDGAVCTFIPDPLGGYGASCASEEDLAGGGAITMLGGAGSLEGSAIAVMVVPDASAQPVVTTPDGARHVADFSGIGAELLPDRSTVQLGAHRVIVPDGS